MRLKELLTERDDAVSPVIGVILMVAITVILAAVIASFVLGLGPGGAAPTINFESSYDTSADSSGGEGHLTIEVTGGDTVTADVLSVTGDVNSSTGGSSWNEIDGSPYSADSEITSGSSVTVDTEADDYAVDVVWTSEDGGTTQTLTTFSA